MTWITIDLDIDEFIDQIEMEQLVNALSESDIEELKELLNTSPNREEDFISLFKQLADYGVEDFLKELPYVMAKYDLDLSVLCEQQIKSFKGKL